MYYNFADLTFVNRELAQVWPGWTAVKVLGKGGFGAVYEIHRNVRGNLEKAALKILRIPENDMEVEQLRMQGMSDQNTEDYYKKSVDDTYKEIAIMQKFIGNSHLVSYEDYTIRKRPNEIGWDIFIRMELLSGLMDYLRSKNPEEETVLKMGVHISQGLSVCHRKGVIHRDIKPQNIFVNENGDFKLGDFGVSRNAPGTHDVLSFKGTLAYMAPEVYRMLATDARSDIYSLGMVLYQCLNDNRLPFVPETFTPRDLETARMRRFNGEPIPEPAHGSPELKEIVLKTLEIRPEDRIQTSEELYYDLSEIYRRDYGIRHKKSSRGSKAKKTTQDQFGSALETTVLNETDSGSRSSIGAEQESGAVTGQESSTGAGEIQESAAVPEQESSTGAGGIQESAAVPEQESGTGAGEIQESAAVPEQESSAGADWVSGVVPGQESSAGAGWVSGVVPGQESSAGTGWVSGTVPGQEGSVDAGWVSGAVPGQESSADAGWVSGAVPGQESSTGTGWDSNTGAGQTGGSVRRRYVSTKKGSGAGSKDKKSSFYEGAPAGGGSTPPDKPKKNNKVIVIVAIAAVCLLFAFTIGRNEILKADKDGVFHQHRWIEATCTSPRICKVCGATSGTAAGHDWKDATCTEPKTCSKCGATEGEPLGHDWKEATCTEPKTCSRCNTTEGEALGHVWIDATYDNPQTCERCGETVGKVKGYVPFTEFTGEFAEETIFLGDYQIYPVILDNELIGCRKIQIGYGIKDVDGDVFGEFELWGKSDGEWVVLGTFEVTELDKRYVNEFTLDPAINISEIACKPSSVRDVKEWNGYYNLIDAQVTVD